MSIIHIADHLTDEILDDITEDNFWSDNHHKSLLNNQETFDFVTFADKPYSQYLEKMNRIIIPDEDGELVELFIRNTRKYREGDAVLTEVYTSATYVKLKTAKQMTPHRTEAITASAHAIRALNGTEWEPGNIDFKGVRTFTFDDYVNPYDYLRRIASEFDLELRFRVETDGNKITKRYVDIVEYVGAWDGKEVEFEKDLAGIERKEDFSNVVTALIGLGPEDEEGNRLSVLVEDEEALQRWGRNGQHIIGIYEPESTDASMTIERLTTLTENELEKRINSKIQYLANVVDLEKVIGLEHEKLRFGDVIRIKDLKFNPPLYLEARVHTVDRSIKPRGHKTVILGDFIEYTEEDVHALVKDLRRQLRNKIGLGDLEELTYTKPEVDQKVSDVVDDAQQAAVEVVDSIEIGGRNIASVDSVGTSGVTRDGYTYTIAKTGSSNPYMRIPASRFEENKRYVISFKVKKISGNITSIAGHDQSFRGMPVEIYRDGVRIEGVTTWSVGDQNYPNDNEVHEYEIRIKTPETFPSGDSAPYWYIQPNRPNYGENYGLELWNFQIEQATKKSDWVRPQDDVDKDIQDAKDEAEEAKQTADNAQQSANGKNTVFYQPTEPSTEGRNEDDLWFNTSDGYKPHRFNGTEWEEAPFGHQAIASIDVGKVVVGRLDGQHIATETIEAEHIKSLNGLVVGDNQFVVDENGNAIFGGTVSGAEIIGSIFTQDSAASNIRLDDEGLTVTEKTHNEKIHIGIKQFGGHHGGDYGIYFVDPNDDQVASLTHWYNETALRSNSGLVLEGGDFGVQIDGSSVQGADYGVRLLGGLGSEEIYSRVVRSFYSKTDTFRNYQSGVTEVNGSNNQALWLGQENTSIVEVRTPDLRLASGRRRLYATSMRTEQNTNTLIQPYGNNEVLVINADNQYRPIRASSFPTGSLAEFKTDIKEWEGSALSIIAGDTTIYEYRLKDDMDKLRYGLVVGDGYNTPEEVIDGDGVEQYLMNSISWKAIQEITQILIDKGIIDEKDIKL